MDFNVHIYGSFELFGRTFYITETIFNTWIVMLVLIIFGIIARIAIKRFTDKPTGFQNVLEIMVESMINFANSNLGEKYAYFANWFFGIFAFILCSNLTGLFGLRPPTADIATTLAMALVTFCMMHFMGITKNTKAYFKGYLEPFFLFLPINIIGAVSSTVSLSFRLFGNILGGMIIMGLFYQMPWFLKIGIPAALHLYFDVFAGFLQTFIFVVLSLTFIRDKLGDES